MFLITGYCTPGATRNEVEWLVCWWNECMPEVKNKCIIINYKSMAQYVHGTSVQQCVLDQLSGASVAQSTQHVMYHLLIHWKPWHPQTQPQHSCLPLSLIAPTPIPQSQPPQLPAVASSPSIWAHAAVPAASLGRDRSCASWSARNLESELWETTVHALIENAGMHNTLEKSSAK